MRVYQSYRLFGHLAPDNRVMGEFSGDWDCDEDGDGGEEWGMKDSEVRRRPYDDIVYGSDSDSGSTNSSSSSASTPSSTHIQTDLCPVGRMERMEMV